MALKKNVKTRVMPKKKAKTAPVSKKKSQKVSKSSSKQQSQLKTLFRASNFKTTPQSNPVKRRAPVPPNQRVWRKTIVRTKPKKEAKLPRLFRADRRTGLPLDYERTVEHVMNYVNPYIGSRRRRTPEEELEEVMANMFVQLVQHGPDHQDPCEITQKLCSMLQNARKDKGHCNGKCDCQMWKCTNNGRNEGLKQNAALSDFYSACKRGPARTGSPLGPTRKSRFNYNQLKIKST
ncbi:uncharacterized protein LOC6595586 [Drosophila persimilis]|uniref:uncharacterized protein LOC6595586 n=1 Tax=Drosophila persimilis TaxID=7234 RepID=UPI000F0851B2|nr:uncharacterized protein LOC6595586 [Drosophila persimilis]